MIYPFKDIEITTILYDYGMMLNDIFKMDCLQSNNFFLEMFNEKLSLLSVILNGITNESGVLEKLIESYKDIISLKIRCKEIKK